MPPYKVGSRNVYLVGDLPEEWTLPNLAPGEVQDYVALKKECKAKGQRFVDKTFNPDTMDIVGRDYENKYPFTYQVQEWKRPRDANKNSVFSVRDEKGNRYGHEDVFQGQLGDCFHLAALAIVADNPKLVNFVIPEDNNEEEDVGIFHFRFWKHGYFWDVVIDDRLPYYRGTPIAGQPNGNEIWPCLMEKAYAKLSGTYAVISGGSVCDALEDLTGGLIDSQKLTPGGLVWEAFSPKGKLTQVFAGLGTPHGPTPDTVADPRTGLCFGHAYSILGREELKTNSGETVRLLKVRNPHGRTEWNGAWSDYPRPSAEWNTVSQADRDRLLKSKNEGEFYMTLYDASNTTFDSITYCYWLDDLDKADPEAGKRYQWQEIHGEWKNPHTTGLGEGWAAMANSPQYRININHVEGTGSPPGQGAIVIELLRKGSVQKTDGPGTQFKFELFWVKNQSLANAELPYKQNSFAYGDLKQNSDVLQNMALAPQSNRERFSGAMVPEGTYVIVPTCDPPGQEGRFLLRVVSEGAGKVTAAPPPAPGDGKDEPQRGPGNNQPQSTFSWNEDPNPNSFSYVFDPNNTFNFNDIPYYNDWNDNGGFQNISWRF